jgi:predicted HTH transcriptional regulator
MQLTPATKLSEWTHDWIKEILDSDRAEDAFLEFKAELNNKDPKSSYNIRKSLTSFANTLGGFVVFGIKDKQAATGWDRLCGLGDTSEFAKQLTNKLSGGKVIPSITFEGPAFFELEHSKKKFSVGVIKVNIGELRPYAIVSDQDGLLHFWARGNQTAIAMTYPSLTKTVEESSQLRNWLAALYLDTEYIDSFADRMLIDEASRETNIPVVKINAIINSDQSSQIISLVPNDVQLVKLIWHLREQIDLVNSFRDMMIQRRSLPLSNSGSQNKADNDRIASIVPIIKSVTQELRSHLVAKYPKIREWLAAS